MSVLFTHNYRSSSKLMYLKSCLNKEITKKIKSKLNYIGLEKFGEQNSACSEFDDVQKEAH